ncbi:MAG: hypothetical protein A3G36_06060 [Omnitrophica bacterium RIFCSPLOWO2_12_FULL_45_13]|nr:MAG: hypothetical protein A3G36_06060 [Omnitrophica bacterium RIFCSPLOWO2_12_FULL_45_13]
MEIISKINWVDVLVAIIMIRMSYVAFREGLSHEIFPFIGSVVIAMVSLHYYMRIGSFISQNVASIPAEISNFFSFLVLVVVVGLAVKLLGKLPEKILKVEWHPIIEKFGGLVVGMMRAYIITGVVLMILALMPLSYLQWSIRDKSLIGKYVLMAGPEIYSRLSRFLPTIKAGEPALTKDTIAKNLMSDKSISPKSNKKEKNVPADKPSHI